MVFANLSLTDACMDGRTARKHSASGAYRLAES